MNEFDIFSAIGGVGEDILEEAETAVRRKINMIPMAAAAACIAVLAAGIYIANSGSDDIGIDPIHTITTSVTTAASEPEQFTSETSVPVSESVTTEKIPEKTTVTATDSATDTTVITTEKPPESSATEGTTATSSGEEDILVPEWDGLSDLEKYMLIDLNGSTYDQTVTKFDISELEFLCNGEVYGIDEDTREKHSKPCTIYKIKNISENYQVAVLTADGKYTAYSNSTYRPSSLGAYLDDTDFWNRYASFTQLISGDMLIDGEVNHFEYKITGLQQEVEKLLTANPEAIAEINPIKNQDTLYKIRDANRSVIVVYVYSGGYIRVHGESFYIGEEYTNAFAEYVEQNAEEKFVPNKTIPTDIDNVVIPE